MRHCRLAVLAAAVATWLALSATARGDTVPGVWDRARDPHVEDTYALHLEVQRRLTLSGEPGESQALLVRAMLEQAGAETGPDIRLRFDLGRVYLLLGGKVAKDYYQRSATVLKAALHDAPNHPMAEEGWLWLAFACGHTGEHDCERDAYVHVLRLATEEIVRAQPLLNLAETTMHLGDLRGAMDGYREVIRLSGHLPADTTAPLAVWGLAVALDRSGDRLEAEKQALFAISLERSLGARPPWSGSASPLLHNPKEVFFEPAYEIHWYDGLGALALARTATNPSDAARLWRAAEGAFAAYIARALPGDRWVEIAKARHATAKAEREKAERARGKVRPPTPAEGDEVSL